jgi:hypothetical protein
VLLGAIHHWLNDGHSKFSKIRHETKEGKERSKKAWHRNANPKTDRPTERRDEEMKERNETQNDQQNHDATKKAPRKDDPRNYRLANNNCGETSRSTTS